MTAGSGSVAAGPTRSIARSAAVGAGVGLLAGAAAAGGIALPLFFLASAFDRADGVDRPLIRTGLGLAIPAGVLLGLVVAVVVAVWYRRGGDLLREDLDG